MIYYRYCIYLFILSPVFLTASFAQPNSRIVIAADSANSYYGIFFGELPSGKYEKDSLLKQSDKEIRVKDKSTGQSYQVMKYQFLYIKHKQDGIQTNVTGNVLNGFAKVYVRQAQSGDMFYFNITFLDENNQEETRPLVLKVK